ncbi:hypothetical protein PRK78_003784 [Emydomyces testavorans]|uniref:Protein artemis n=1 Tax=Emydomyces testavorans TaxID=2070801 RepID=A0AAF0IJ39_9EURO|nr:hypothetical protein PRK78_003784 [Emydomyces testavorans]
MSTFNGIVEGQVSPYSKYDSPNSITVDGAINNEIVDYFRKNPDKPPPQACFLSHVHSDHLMGLESLRSPFIYCSAATREILLRIEKYPHRMNFAKGILESRKQEYKHLAKLLVPTEIELAPGKTLRVTLFNANHCPGAVMFLIEGNGKAILYTGDVRAEHWWVGSLVRHPVLIPYTLGDRRLDRIYLDTTFAIKPDIYASFPSKAEGIRELLQKIRSYPEDTVFYLRNWTFGYEDVWLAVSAALNTKIHVDPYQMRLYKSLASKANSVDEAPYLCGFTLGNSEVSGCLTDKADTVSVRVHSCEPGVVCSTISSGSSVYITPIVTRTKEGRDILELGAGGGMGDLIQSHHLQLPDGSAVERFVDLCSLYVEDLATRESIINAVSKAYESKSKSLSLDSYGISEEDEITLKNLVAMLSRGSDQSTLPNENQMSPNIHLPNTIRFPYSRHSSYEELCALVEAFRPKDVYPCTVDADSWTESVSMQNLFGHLCSGTVFPHDNEMRDVLRQNEFRPRKKARCGSDAFSNPPSTQASNIEISSSKEIVIPSTMPLGEITYPTVPLSSSSQHKKVEQDTRRPLENIDLAIADTELSFSFPSQLTSNLSQSQPDITPASPDARIQALKQALKQKSLENELDFYFESSFADSQSQSLPQPQARSPSNSQPFFSAIEQEASHHQISPDVNSDFLPPDSPSGCAATEYSSSSPISLSTSAFASQETVPIPSDDDDKREDNSQIAAEPQRLARLKRTRSRASAYRAVKGGTWPALYSLMSAGNNHSLKDEEL